MGARSDLGDAHVLADMVRTDAHQLRLAAGDRDLAEAIKVMTRAHRRNRDEKAATIQAALHQLANRNRLNHPVQQQQAAA